MGLFSRRGTAVAVTSWTPLRHDCIPLSGDDASMADDGQVFASAYEVAFGTPHPDGAVITVWTYVSYGYSPQGPAMYCLGLRYQYTSEAYPDWACTGYESDPAGEVFEDADAAMTEAYDWANSLAAGSPDSIANLPGVFEWDGTPFQMDIE